MIREFSDADTGEQLDPREAVLQLQDQFRSIARQLERRNISLHDDIVQEMSLAVLQETKKANAQWFLYCGVYAARSFLKRERSRGEIRLCDFDQLVVEAQQLSDETLVQALIDDGHSVKVIEEILDCRLVS
ncbi:MAG TPA: hypothetical protein VEJ63_23840 [Planctomycetota bacterium]|nr:hypothetical protein [Planctomycetota bacterium]